MTSLPSRRSCAAVLRASGLASLLACVAIPAAAQSRLPAVRPLGPILARSSEPLGAVSAAVPLPDGRVLVNDVLQRRVVMFDSTLAHVSVVADTTAATANAYGARGGGLIGYRGDSALFIDPASLSMITVNPKGELTTVRAVPRANEIQALSGAQGRPGFDLQGRLVHRATPRPRPAARDARPTIGNFVMPELPDSAPIVRLDMGTRALDTVAAIKINRPNIKVTQGADGRVSVQTTVHPMPTLDEWALLSDGTVAVIRGEDFHVERYRPDGTRTSSAKLPFDWQRLDDDAKQFVLDSSRTAMEKQREEAQRMVNNAGGPMAFIQGGGGEMMTATIGGGMGGGMGGGTFMMMGGGPGGGRGEGGRGEGGRGEGGRGPGGPGGAQGGNGFQLPPINMVAANELPDYRPPFLAQAAAGDLDGNLWVRTTNPGTDGGVIYYVINGADQVTDRVQIPQGRILAGFGRGGLLYLAFRDAQGRAYLETARWR